MEPTPNVFVLSGPTAVGKGTVVKALQDLYPDLSVSVSATTRLPRPGEIDGQDYFFLSENEFARMIDAGELLEYALVHGQAHYGTPRSAVEDELDRGRTVLLEIDLAGARQVRESLPGARFLFLAPPSWEELKRRLIGRGTEGPVEQQRRLETAQSEMAAAPEFDEVVINDNLEEAVARLASLLGLH